MSQATMPCEYDSLTIMQKVEVFEMSLQHTAGQDLSKVNQYEFRDRGSKRTLFGIVFPFVFVLRGGIGVGAPPVVGTPLPPLTPCAPCCCSLCGLFTGRAFFFCPRLWQL